jgi:uncharacterized protein YigE (DUF2233 family)
VRLLVRLIITAALCLPLTVSGAAHPLRTMSPCAAQIFEQSRFTVCSDPERFMDIEIYSTDLAGKPLRSFADFERAYPAEARYVQFGMNAGMFQADGRPLGLLVQHGRLVHPLNRRSGWGNFYLKPNGVFFTGTNDGVTPTDRFQLTKNVAEATQSGPMLVIDGRVNPAFAPDGESRNIRNGVGIDAKGKPVFVISEDRVSFGKFARFFRDALHTRNALYFDGSVSSLWDPEHGRKDDHQQIGPMVIALLRNDP